MVFVLGSLLAPVSLRGGAPDTTVVDCGCPMCVCDGCSCSAEPIPQPTPSDNDRTPPERETRWAPRAQPELVRLPLRDPAPLISSRSAPVRQAAIGWPVDANRFAAMCVWVT